MAVSTLMVTHQDAERKQLAVNDRPIEYVTARVVLRFLDSRWRQFEERAAAERAAEKESFLQENLKAFGAKAGVRYSP